MKMTASGLILLLLSLSLFGEEVTEVTAKETVEKVVWQDDPMCQFVFFAVLEGLYRDGVQNEVVDLVLGEPSERGEDGVKRCFVFRCELCHATYEAFRTYRARPAFQQSGGQATFGKGAGDDLLVALKSDSARTRVYGMGRLVRPWILQRVEETRRTEEEKEAMIKEFRRYAQEGGKRLQEHQENKDQFYLDWRFYGSCQACEAAEDLGGGAK